MRLSIFRWNVKTLMQLPQWVSGETFFFFFPPSEEYMKETWLSSLMWSAALACRGSASVRMIHQDSRCSPDRGQMAHLRLREQELCKSSPSPGSLLSIKLRSTLATNKRENSPRSLPLYHVKRPYVMEPHKHFNNANTIVWAVKLRERKGFGVKIMDLAERVVEAVRYAFQKLGAH